MAMAVAMDLEAELCSICLDPVAAAPSRGARSIALLQCGHKFHLDCIGSAFNAKGRMQCPNCRNIEEGNWLNDANTLPPSIDSNSDFGNGVPRETHEETHEELIHLQPTVEPSTVDRAIREMMRLFSDLTQPSSIDGSIPLESVMRSLFMDNDIEPISYHSNSEPIPVYHHTTGMMEAYPTADLSNVQVFDGTEPRISVVEQPNLGTLPLLDFLSRPTIPFGFEAPRYDGSNNQQHSTEYTPQSGSSSVAPLGPSPAVTFGGHVHGLGGHHVVQQTVSPATPASPYPPITGRRIQMRAFSIASSIAASNTAEDRVARDISRARAAYVQNNNIPSRVHASRRVDQQYPYPLGWDTLWRPSAERGSLRSRRNQGYSSSPSTSTSERLQPGFPSENGYPPSDRTHPFL